MSIKTALKIITFLTALIVTSYFYLALIELFPFLFE